MKSGMLVQMASLTAGYEAGADVVFEIDLSVEAGEVVGLVGPNGCGKSTVLRCLAGQIEPSSGEIRVRQEDMLVFRPDLFRRLGIGYAPQTEAWFDSLTVAENLYAAGYQLRDGEELEAWIKETWKRFPLLETVRRRRAGDLSGGERKILSVAMATIPQVRVLVLDEPTASLASEWIERVGGLLREFSHQRCAVVIAEQNVGFVARMADRVCVMREGRINQTISGEEFGTFLSSSETC